MNITSVCATVLTLSLKTTTRLTRILEHNCLVNKLLVGGWRLLIEITANCFLLFLELLQ